MRGIPSNGVSRPSRECSRPRAQLAARSRSVQQIGDQRRRSVAAGSAPRDPGAARDVTANRCGRGTCLVPLNRGSGAVVRGSQRGYNGRVHRTLLLCAIGVVLCPAVAAGCQAASPVGIALSGALRDHVQDERFQIVTSIRGLPLGVRTELQTLFGSPTLDIADPGAGSQVGDAIANSKPIRRLAAAGCSYDHCLVYYERGGSAPPRRVALFHWTPEATRLEFGGAAPAGLGTIDDVRSAILAGAIDDAAGSW